MEMLAVRFTWLTGIWPTFPKRRLIQQISENQKLAPGSPVNLVLDCFVYDSGPFPERAISFP